MNRMLLAGLTLFLANTALASNWQKIGWGSNAQDSHFGIFMDMSSIQHVNHSRVRVWMRYDHSVPLSAPAVPNQLVWSIKPLEVFDCLNKTSGIASEAYFDAKGDFISSLNGQPLQLAPIVPDSINEHVATLVCKTRQSHHSGKRFTPI